MRYDCHVQVFDPGRWQPPAVSTLPPATATQLQASLARRGIRHAVLVQPRAYREAHGCFLEALRRIGGAASGVAAASRHTCGGDLDLWARSGVRAVRLVLEGDAWAAQEQVHALASRIPRDWPIELEAEPAQLAAAASRLAHSERHFICSIGPQAQRWDAAAWARLLWWADMGNLYLKLLAPAAAPWVDTLAARVPDRLLWGSDWPRSQRTPPPALARLAPTLDGNAAQAYGLAGAAAFPAGYGGHEQAPLASGHCGA